MMSAFSLGNMTEHTYLTMAFDVDNTLLDPDMRAYNATVPTFLTGCDVGLRPDEAFEGFEGVRSKGDAMERIGLRSGSHYRGDPDFLAVFCMTCCTSPGLRGDLRIGASDQSEYNEVLSELVTAYKAARKGSGDQRLDAERRLRTFCSTDARIARFRGEAERIARHPKIVGWADVYRTLELAQPVDNLLPFMERLASGGIIPVVISEGRTEIQLEKVSRLGLAEFFRGRILITQQAAAVPGLGLLDEAISQMIDEWIGTASGPASDELRTLWYYRCLIDGWATKSASFYARCLHALHHDIEHPQDTFDTPVYVPPNTWEANPLRFVSVGDRYDKDVAPLIDLLSPTVGMKIRLRMGKYGHLHPEEELAPDRRPDKTFTDWDSLATFLAEDLTPEMIPPITAPPDIVNRADLRPDYIERGLDSPYQAVRCVARAVAPMLA